MTTDEEVAAPGGEGGGGRRVGQRDDVGEPVVVEIGHGGRAHLSAARIENRLAQWGIRLRKSARRSERGAEECGPAEPGSELGRQVCAPLESIRRARTQHAVSDPPGTNYPPIETRVNESAGG